MTGTLIKQESNWYVKYTKNNKNIFWPLEPESLLTHKCKPNTEVTFKITQNGKAKLTIKENPDHELPSELLILCEKITNEPNQPKPICPYPKQTQGYIDWINGFQTALEWIQLQNF